MTYKVQNIMWAKSGAIQLDQTTLGFQNVEKVISGGGGGGEMLEEMAGILCIPKNVSPW